MIRHNPSSGIGGFHCTGCGLRVEYSTEKGAMVDISGAAYCVDLEPHRITTFVPAPGFHTPDFAIPREDQGARPDGTTTDQV